MRRLVALCVSAFAVSGCGTVLTRTGRVGYVLSSFRLPFTIPMRKCNGPLGLTARRRLEEIDRLASAGDRRNRGKTLASLANEDGLILLPTGEEKGAAGGPGGATHSGPRAITASPAAREPEQDVSTATRLVESVVGRMRSRQDRVDTLGDLKDKGTIVMVALSGGGARAAAFARHVMAQLEETYNKERKELAPEGETASLFDSIDAYSSVSGGSVYLSHAAARNTVLGWKATRKDRINSFFGDLDRAGVPIVGTSYLGALCSMQYAWPLNPPMMLATDWTYLDLLADTLTWTYPFPWRPTYFSLLDLGPRLGDLPARPRFYFNATCLETGTPFVITQSILHLPSEMALPLETNMLQKLSVAASAPGTSARPTCEFPLPSALTLENINSSPAKFPLAYAAMASASFPILQDPLRVRKYDYVKSTSRFPSLRRMIEPIELYYRGGPPGPAGSIAATSTLLHLTDGGVYDNSGMCTAVSIFEHLVREGKAKRLVLLQVSADNCEYDADAATRIDPSWNRVAELAPESLFPVRGMGGAYKSLLLMNYLNERRAEYEALARLDELVNNSKSKRAAAELDAQSDKRTAGPDARPEVSYLYFPVRLSRLSPRAAQSVQSDEQVFQRVQKIPTDFTISPEDDQYLAKAAAIILTTPCKARPAAGAPADPASASPRTRGYTSGPWLLDPGDAGPVECLDVAFARAILRAQQGRREPKTP